MRIIRLQAENIKRIKAIDITPPEYVVVVSGKNAAGKTSALDSIWLTLDKAASQENVKPIRKGEESAKTVIDFGEIIVSRKWTSNSTSYLTVATKEGAEYKAPQTMLHSMMSDFSLDPLAFMKSGAKEQAKTLLKIANVTVEDLDEKRKTAYDERTAVNREAKNLKAQVDAIEIPEDTPTEEVSSEALLKTMRAREEMLESNRVQREKLERLESTEVTVQKRIEELQEALKAEKKKLSELQTQIKTQREYCEALIDPDMSDIEKKVKEVDWVNAMVRERKRKQALEEELISALGQADSLTATIEGADKEKAERFTNAKLPIEGLGVDETGVTYNGMPLAQCSSAEQLKVSLAIAMANDPKIRVIRITDGSLLDSDSMAYLEQIAREKDYQVWIERVDESGTVGIYIEDGEVKA